MDAPKPTPLTSSQPQQSIQMDAVNPAAPVNSQQQQHKTHRLRGGGAARDCFLGMVECFLCFECCKVRLIIACPHPCCHPAAPPCLSPFRFNFHFFFVIFIFCPSTRRDQPLTKIPI
ncbi:hypothetical protein BJV78DRAFT_727405 [Lactifluus subvellereus]|nr:hypothetical protein BJV78DRAFT_727405 [Lactifluus subvellereus]